jgi:methyl-accepting chemotaxis protein
LLIGFALDELEKQRVANLTAIGTASLLVLVLGIGLSIAIGTLFVRPVRRLTAITSNIVERGDLTQSIDVDSSDEVGQLAESFRLMVEKLRAIPVELGQLVNSVVDVADRLANTTQAVSRDATVVRDGVDDTSATTEEMLASLKSIATNLSALRDDAQRTAASNTQMLSGTRTVAASAQTMVGSVRSASQGVEQMTDAVRRIASNVDTLERSIAAASDAASEMAASVGQVEGSARETASLAERVSKDAAGGVTAIDETLRGIERIRASSTAASELMQSLGKRIGSVGSILNVISEVADQTNLLALNAAIIAAQAGDHGRGFSVVADEIKSLADRTRTSTKEIAQLVEVVQAESDKALEAIAAGERDVLDGVRLGQQAAGALRTIHQSSDNATHKVRMIAEATQHQAEASQRLSGSVQHIVQGVRQIHTLTSEQAAGCDQILGLNESMGRITEEVQRSSTEQARDSEQIAQAVDRITVMVKNVYAAQEEQTRAAAETMGAVDRIKTVADQQAGTVGSLERAVADLRTRAEALRVAMRQFRI